MTKAIGAVEIKRQRGKLTVQGLSKTPRGQRFIAGTVNLEAKSMADENFKAQVKAAIKALYD